MGHTNSTAFSQSNQGKTGSSTESRLESSSPISLVIDIVSYEFSKLTEIGSSKPELRSKVSEEWEEEEVAECEESVSSLTGVKIHRIALKAVRRI
jgi:hypothetical protein